MGFPFSIETSKIGRCRPGNPAVAYLDVTCDYRGGRTPAHQTANAVKASQLKPSCGYSCRGGLVCVVLGTVECCHWQHFTTGGATGLPTVRQRHCKTRNTHAEVHPALGRAPSARPRVASFTVRELRTMLRVLAARGVVDTSHSGRRTAVRRRSQVMNPQSVERQDASSSVSDPPGGDHDQPYRWGRPPTTYLAYRQVVRLTILRSKLEDVRTQRLG